VQDDPAAKIIRPHKLILDPEALNDEDGYKGRFLGEVRKMEAGLLKSIISSNKDKIEEAVDWNMGTDVAFIEWWTPEYTCWTFKEYVLLKKKNPYWNYDSEKEMPPAVDEMGLETPTPAMPVKGVNFFKEPKIPYVFLTMFNLGKGPVDNTSLITQNLSQQDLINKRLRQLDKNVDSMNGGLVISGERSGLTREQAGQVSSAMRKGGTVFIPSGAPSDAVQRFPATGLPNDVYQQLVDTRTRLQDVFGVRGSNTGGIANEKTVRGKIIVQGLDSDRIGGGITARVEEFVDDIFNYMVQLLYVYQPAILQGVVTPPPLIVSITSGSMLPKDNVSEANQALELWSAQAIDPITLFEKLQFPNPQETAKKLFLWQNNPQALFPEDPEIQQFIQRQQMAAQQQQQAQAGQEEAKAQSEAQRSAQQAQVASALSSQGHAQTMEQIRSKQLLQKVPTNA